MKLIKALRPPSIALSLLLCAGTVTPQAPPPGRGPGANGGGRVTVTIQRDLDYGNGQKLDLYALSGPALRPLVVWFHDGEKYPTPLAHLIADGYAVASVGYRSGQTADAQMALDWLRANAAKNRLDTAHVALAGDDKGGQVATKLATAGGFQAVIAIFPAVEKIGQPSTGTLPPFLVLHGTADTVVAAGQSENFVYELKAAGADATLEYVARAGHDLRQIVTPETTEVIANFLDRTLRGNTHERAAITSFPLPADTWEDPFTMDSAFTQYKTYPTPARGPNARSSYQLYLPPDYNESKSRRYPVIYYLHGANESAATATAEANYIQRLDAAIRAKVMPPAIVIVVQAPNRAFYIDSQDGQFPVESVLIKNLIPHVDATYRTVARREGRAIEGHSMGGFGALHLAFKYPDLFASVASFAAALVDAGFGVDAEYFKAQTPATLLAKNADRLRGHTTIRMIVGDKDNLAVPNRAFDETLTRMNIPHEFYISKGAPHSVREVLARLDFNPFKLYAKAFARLP